MNLRGAFYLLAHRIRHRPSAEIAPVRAVRSPRWPWAGRHVTAHDLLRNVLVFNA
jgi:hypothetical protein